MEQRQVYAVAFRCDLKCLVLHTVLRSNARTYQVRWLKSAILHKCIIVPEALRKSNIIAIMLLSFGISTLIFFIFESGKEDAMDVQFLNFEE